jgi:hypothetical protein
MFTLQTSFKQFWPTGGGVKSVSRGDCEGGKLLRLLSQLRPKIRPPFMRLILIASLLKIKWRTVKLNAWISCRHKNVGDFFEMLRLQKTQKAGGFSQYYRRQFPVKPRGQVTCHPTPHLHIPWTAPCVRRTEKMYSLCVTLWQPRIFTNRLGL